MRPAKRLEVVAAVVAVVAETKIRVVEQVVALALRA